MKLRLKEDPREWRKSTLLTLLGLAFISSILCWRRVLPPAGWRVVLGILALIALSAWLRPRWFRGYYRVSARIGFFLSQALARVVLVVIFVLFITPLGLLLRLLGKDPLRLSKSTATSYWLPAKANSPLDRQF